jgi:alginate O-acetyltransferase complex protein AlgJ
MQRIYQSSRYLLAVSFFAYGAYANFALFTGGKATLDGKTDIMHGAVTAQIDKLYKNDLPHRDAAIGLVGAARYLLIGEGRSGVLTGTDGWLFTKEEARVMAADMDVTLDRIVDVRDQLAVHGTQLLILPVPAKSDVYADLAANPEMSSGMAALYDDFIAGLDSKGIATIDARPALIAEKVSKPAFFATDTHWTEAGAQAVAVAVAASKVIEKGGDSFATVSDGTAAFTGDLVSFVTSDGLAPMVGLAQEEARPYRAELAVASDQALSATDLFAAPSTGGIVLVGTSYSANPRWSFAEALKIALGADVLNYAEEGQGPARPMLSYLDSADLRDAPPAWVIWEIPVRYLPDATIWDRKTVGGGSTNGA